MWEFLVYPDSPFQVEELTGEITGTIFAVFFFLHHMVLLGRNIKGRL